MLNKFPPEHAIGDNAIPLLTDKLGCIEGLCIQIVENLLCDVIQTFG